MAILRIVILSLLLTSFVTPTGNYKDLVLFLDLRKNQGKVIPDQTGINYCVMTGTSNGYNLNGYSFLTANSDIIDCGNSSAVNATDKLTIAAWVFMRSTATAVCKTTTASTGFSYNIVYNSDNRVYFQMSGNGTTVAYSQTQVSYTTGMWVHCVGVYDGAGAANADKNKVYINGVQVGCNFSGTIPSSLFQSPSNLKINSINNTSSGTGKIGQVKIWERALTPTEVRYEYTSTRSSVIN